MYTRDAFGSILSIVTEKRKNGKLGDRMDWTFIPSPPCRDAAKNVAENLDEDDYVPH